MRRIGLKMNNSYIWICALPLLLVSGAVSMHQPQHVGCGDSLSSPSDVNACDGRDLPAGMTILEACHSGLEANAQFYSILCARTCCEASSCGSPAQTECSTLSISEGNNFVQLRAITAPSCERTLAEVKRALRGEGAGISLYCEGNTIQSSASAAVCTSDAVAINNMFGTHLECSRNFFTSGSRYSCEQNAQILSAGLRSCCLTENDIAANPNVDYSSMRITALINNSISFVCTEGYSLGGVAGSNTYSATCSLFQRPGSRQYVSEFLIAGRSASSPVETCQRNSCIVNSAADPNGNFSALEISGNGRIYSGIVTCHAGFYPNGIVSSGTTYYTNCLNTGLMNSSVRCNIARCAILPQEPNAHASNFPAIGYVEVGQTVNFVCEAGMYYNGTTSTTYTLACTLQGEFAARSGSPCITNAPTQVPSTAPTSPTNAPTGQPSTNAPTSQPSASPGTSQPSIAPASSEPSYSPSISPTLVPTLLPTSSQPTSSPTWSCSTDIVDNNASFSGRVAAVGSSVTISCNEHYAIAGDVSRGYSYNLACENNRGRTAFTEFTDRCELVFCLTRPIDIHAEQNQTFLIPADTQLNGHFDVNGTDTFLGTDMRIPSGVMAQYTCRNGSGVSGFRDVRTYSIECLSSGRFSRPTGVCEPFRVSCTGAPADINAAHDVRALAFASINYVCNTGFGVDGTTMRSYQIQCSGEGLFGPKLHSCLPVQCDTSSLPTDTQATASANGNGSYTYTCTSAHAVNGVPGASSYLVPCNTTTGLFIEPTHTCSSIRCTTPPTDPNAIISAPFAVALESVTYTCNPNYAAGGNPGVLSYDVRCQRDGSFRVSRVNCTRITCTLPSISSANIVTGQTPTAGTTLTYRCNPGFGSGGVHQASITATCRATGSLSSFSSDCVPMRCSAPPRDENANNSIPTSATFAYGRTVRYTCLQNYGVGGEPISSYDVQCGSSMDTSGLAFSVPDIRCEQIFCSVPIFNNSVPTRRSVPAGTNVRYICDPGYGFLGNGAIFSYSVLCSDSGTLELGSQGCESIRSCTDPPNDPYATVSISQSSTQKIFRYACNAFHGVGGNAEQTSYERRCSFDTGLISSPACTSCTCQPVECNVPTILGTEIQSVSSIVAGSRVTYSCLPGSILTVETAGSSDSDLFSLTATTFDAICEESGEILLPENPECIGQPTSVEVCSVTGAPGRTTSIVPFITAGFSWEPTCDFTLISDCVGQFEVQVGRPVRSGYRVNSAIAVRFPSGVIVELHALDSGGRTMYSNGTALSLPWDDGLGSTIQPLAFGHRQGAAMVRVEDVGVSLWWNAGGAFAVKIDTTSPLLGPGNQCGACALTLGQEATMSDGPDPSLFSAAALLPCNQAAAPFPMLPVLGCSQERAVEAANYCSEIQGSRYRTCYDDSVMLQLQSDCISKYCGDGAAAACEVFAAVDLLCRARGLSFATSRAASECRIGSSKSPYSASCFTTGGQHFGTFDGGSVDAWAGQCTYTMLSVGDFEVQIRNTRRPNKLYNSITRTYVDSVAVKLPGGTIVTLGRGDSITSHSVNGAPLTASQMPLQDELGNRIEYSRGHSDRGAAVIVFVPKYEAVVYWNGRTSVAIWTTATGPLSGTTSGLCGDFNGNANDDAVQTNTNDYWKAGSGTVRTSLFDNDTLCEEGEPVEDFTCNSTNATLFCQDLVTESGNYALCASIPMAFSSSLHAACLSDYCVSDQLACEALVLGDRLCRESGLGESIANPNFRCNFQGVDWNTTSDSTSPPQIISSSSSNDDDDGEVIIVSVVAVIVVVALLVVGGYYYLRSDGGAQSGNFQVSNPAFVGVQGV